MPDSDSCLPNIDVAKLEELLHDTQKQQEIGNQVLKGVIIDVLRSKAGGTEIPWIVRHLGVHSCVLAVLQELVDDVALTEAELKLLKELEGEPKQDCGPGGE